jgi:hypothetical protein
VPLILKDLEGGKFSGWDGDSEFGWAAGSGRFAVLGPSGLIVLAAGGRYGSTVVAWRHRQ